MSNTSQGGINFFNHLAWVPDPDIYPRHCMGLSPPNLSTPDGASIKVHTEQGSSYGPHFIFQCRCWLTLLQKDGKEDLSSVKLDFPLCPPTPSELRHNVQAKPGPGELMISPLEVTWEDTDKPAAFPSSCEVSLPQLLLSLLFVL